MMLFCHISEVHFARRITKRTLRSLEVAETLHLYQRCCFLLAKHFFLFFFKTALIYRKHIVWQHVCVGSVWIQKTFGCLYSMNHSLLLALKEPINYSLPSYLLTNTLGECIVDRKHHLWAQYTIFHSSMLLFAFLNAIFFEPSEHWWTDWLMLSLNQ